MTQIEQRMVVELICVPLDGIQWLVDLFAEPSLRGGHFVN